MNKKAFGVPPIPCLSQSTNKKKKGRSKMEIRKKKSAGQSGSDGNEELRTKIVSLYLSPTEFKKLTEYFSKSAQTTMANFCREKLLSKPGTTTDKKEILSEISYSIYQQSKISTNINQIAKKVNTLKKDYPELISELQLELEELKQLNKAMLSKFKKIGG